jgi:hypothetical protein
MKLDGPTAVQVLATVTSADVVTSPLGGARGAVVQLEVLEGATELVGVVNVGDTLALRCDDGAALVLVVGRVTLSFDPAFDPPACVAVPLTSVVAELVPTLRRAKGLGAIAVRERVLRQGDRVRLEAVLEPGLTVRDDLGAVRIEVVR